MRMGGFPGRAARESDMLVEATLPAKKGQFFWSVLSGETSRSSGNLLSSVAWKSAAFPFGAKEAASPSKKRPQILRIDDGKGYFCFGLSC